MTNPFGFTINKTRSINLDDCDYATIRELEEAVPSFKRCMYCGGCTATCSAGHFTNFNIRKNHYLFRIGQFDKIGDNLKQCMLCGNCTLVCPRGINLRSMIINMRKILAEKR